MRSNPVKAAPAAPETKQAVDFFGRAIVAKATGDSAGAGTPSSLALITDLSVLLTRLATAGQNGSDSAPPPSKRVRQAVYRYHEGFSNAVRVTKRVSDFVL